MQEFKYSLRLLKLLVLSMAVDVGAFISDVVVAVVVAVESSVFVTVIVVEYPFSATVSANEFTAFMNQMRNRIVSVGNNKMGLVKLRRIFTFSEIGSSKNFMMSSFLAASCKHLAYRCSDDSF